MCSCLLRRYQDARSWRARPAACWLSHLCFKFQRQGVSTDRKQLRGIGTRSCVATRTGALAAPKLAPVTGAEAVLAVTDTTSVCPQQAPPAKGFPVTPIPARFTGIVGPGVQRREMEGKRSRTPPPQPDHPDARKRAAASISGVFGVTKGPIYRRSDRIDALGGALPGELVILAQEGRQLERLEVMGEQDPRVVARGQALGRVRHDATPLSKPMEVCAEVVATLARGR